MQTARPTTMYRRVGEEYVGRGKPVSWALAIDFGTTATVAAIDDGTHVRLVTFGRSTRLPSGVFVGSDGSLLVGTTAANQGGADPARYVRTPKRHVGRDQTVIVGGTAYEVADLVAMVLRTAHTEAITQAGAGEPERVILTHPVRWSRTAQGTLRDAANRAGLGQVELVPEPMAAGQYAAVRHGAAGAIAVYDLGGGTFDAAVLQRTDAGIWTVLGPPGGLDPLGGETFDVLLHRHLLTQLDGVDKRMARVLESPLGAGERGFSRTWWRDLRSLKEDLSEVSAGRIAVPGSDHTLTLARDELEALLGPAVHQTVDEFDRVVRAASSNRSLSIVVSGDASRMPLVHELIRQRFPDAPVTSIDDPKGAVACGALAISAPPVATAAATSTTPSWMTSAMPPVSEPPPQMVPPAPPQHVDPLTTEQDVAAVAPHGADHPVPQQVNSGSGSMTAVWVAGGVAALLLVVGVIALAVIGLGSGSAESTGGTPPHYPATSYDPPDDTATTTSNDTPDGTTRPPSRTDDTLEGLRTDCAIGDMVACDELYVEAPGGSALEEFAMLCGGGGSGEQVTGPDCAGDYGTGLISLGSDCMDGDMAACDLLYHDSPAGSFLEGLAMRCGGGVDEPSIYGGECVANFG